MRVTIIPSDFAVYVDGVVYHPLALDSCGIPPNIHALQWYNTYGHLELYDEDVFRNQTIVELPEWATACIAVWQIKDSQIKAPPTEEQLDFLAKGQRFYLLNTSDWTQLPNSILTDSKKQEWEDYRQLLRDVTNQPNYPFTINWPLPPIGN